MTEVSFEWQTLNEEREKVDVSLHVRVDAMSKGECRAKRREWHRRSALSTTVVWSVRENSGISHAGTPAELCRLLVYHSLPPLPHCPPNHNPIVYASRDEGHEAGRTGMSMTMVSRATPLRTRFIEFLYLPNLVWL